LDFSKLKKICVDETATRRGHNYVTIFSDGESRDVAFVTDVRKQENFGMLCE
jgi:hypothetical protein